MVDRISQYVNTYLAPLKRQGAKQDEIRNNAIQNSFFDKIDKDNNEELDANETAVISNAIELNPEDQNEKQIMEMAAQVSQIAPDKTETVLALDNNGVNEIVVISKPAEDGTVLIKTLTQGDQEHPLVLSEERSIKDNVETITKFNADGSKSVQKGAVTTNFDPQGRITSVVKDKGSGVTESVEYLYEGDSNVPVKQVNVAPDGTRTELTENLTNPNEAPVEGPSSTPSASAPSSVPSASAPSEEAPNASAADHNGPVYAKEGESFLKTAQRIFGDPNLTKDDPRYQALAQANPRDARRNWFRLGAEIRIPDGVREQLADAAFGVDNAAEERQYVDRAVNQANTDRYNDDNTEMVTLDRSDSWWNLAKRNLQSTGVSNPTYAQIYERIGELVKMNPGKEPTAGTELKMPKVNVPNPTPSAAPAAAPSTPPATTPPDTTPPAAHDPNPPQRTVTPPTQDATPPANCPTETLTLLNTPVPDKAGQEVRNNDGTVTVYDENGYISQIKDTNGYPTFAITRNEDNSIKELEQSVYDSNGNCTKLVTMDKDGKVQSYYDFEYDADGNPTRSTIRNADGSVAGTTEYTYENGKFSNELFRDASGTLTSYSHREYDASGEISRINYYDADGNLTAYTQKDENGNMVTYNPDGTVKPEEDA